MARLLGQLPDELTLRPAVPFTEGMKHVDFPEIVAGPLAELVGIEAAQELFLGKLPKELLRRALDRNLPGYDA